jgi:hypothetical protein
MVGHIQSYCRLGGEAGAWGKLCLGGGPRGRAREGPGREALGTKMVWEGEGAVVTATFFVWSGDGVYVLGQILGATCSGVAFLSRCG